MTDESGKVYLAEQREGEWNTREVWTDSERPIIAMIHFADGRPPYVFGKDFYFRLARKPRVNPCRDVTRGSEELGDPMRTVWECAKVLHEARELSDGPPARRAAAGQD